MAAKPVLREDHPAQHACAARARQLFRLAEGSGTGRLHQGRNAVQEGACEPRRHRFPKRLVSMDHVDLDGGA